MPEPAQARGGSARRRILSNLRAGLQAGRRAELQECQRRWLLPADRDSSQAGPRLPAQGLRNRNWRRQFVRRRIFHNRATVRERRRLRLSMSQESIAPGRICCRIRHLLWKAGTARMTCLSLRRVRHLDCVLGAGRDSAGEDAGVNLISRGYVRRMRADNISCRRVWIGMGL